VFREPVQCVCVTRHHNGCGDALSNQDIRTARGALAAHMTAVAAWHRKPFLGVLALFFVTGSILAILGEPRPPTTAPHEQFADANTRADLERR